MHSPLQTVVVVGGESLFCFAMKKCCSMVIPKQQKQHQLIREIERGKKYFSRFHFNYPVVIQY
jgi:hypothetical protein